MYMQHDLTMFTARSTLEPPPPLDASPVPLLSRGSMPAMRARFQLDVVLEHVLVSHHVQLTDKELRLTFQRDSKHINSDPAIWRNNVAEFRQVVGLQSTLTRSERSSSSSATFEPKLYHFIVTSLPSQTQVAHFELDIALYLNKSLTLSLPALPTSRDPSARLSLNIKCHLVDRTKKQRADTMNPPDMRASTRLMDMPGRHTTHSKPSLVRSSTLTDSSSTMVLLQVGGGIHDTVSEYSDDGHASIERLTRQLEGQQRKNKKLQGALALAEKKLDGAQHELEELQVREEGETQHGMQLRTWNLALLQEFEILKLRVIENAMAMNGSLEPAYEHIEKINELTRDAYIFEPETAVDEMRDSDGDDDDDDNLSFGSSTRGHEIDSNFNFDPEVEWSGGSPKNESMVLEEKSFTTLADDVPALSPTALQADGNNLLLDELRAILKRNHRLQQTTEFLLVALQPPATPAPPTEPTTVAVSLQPIPPLPAPKELDDLGLGLAGDIDLNARLKQLQVENDKLRSDHEQFQAQLQLSQGLGRLNTVTAENTELAAKIAELEAALAAAPSAAAFRQMEVDLAAAQAQTIKAEKRLQELERCPTPRSEMASESVKHMQMLKQENLAMKFRLTTLEPLQEKYEIAEKERKRLSLRLQQYTDHASADEAESGPRSRVSTMDKSHDVDSLTRQRVAAMDMQINVLNELHRTQTMQIQHMEEDYAKLRGDFVAHMNSMQEAMAALRKEHELLQTPQGRRAALQTDHPLG
ncbi:hypothetical protein ACHHYP_12786 [Achlya hypogyna]|uniref:C2 NT-type domain-containing protein n=1 Tax=Achlya hypogyna TaxID=1202772 RepID=A0A1V9YGF8_ACHHY|nr:hypothetical protein ACHHYP_12786 [Achlya hypogyna]